MVQTVALSSSDGWPSPDRRTDAIPAFRIIHQLSALGTADARAHDHRHRLALSGRTGLHIRLQPAL
ncbi:MAG: hypothetical protein ABIO06_09675 [Pseudolysinimonas sp.]